MSTIPYIPPFPEDIDYSHSSDILVIADGLPNSDGVESGKALVETFAKIHVVSTNLVLPTFAARVIPDWFEKLIDRSRLLEAVAFSDHHVYVTADNRDKLPFSDHSFDHILIRYGLCFCGNSIRSCAGIPQNSLKEYLDELLRIIKHQNGASIWLAPILECENQEQIKGLWDNLIHSQKNEWEVDWQITTQGKIVLTWRFHNKA